MSNTNKKIITPLTHLIAWVVVFVIPVIIFLSEGRGNSSEIIIRSLMQFPFLLILFYANYLWCIDTFLFKKKYTIFILINVLLILLASNIKYEMLFGGYFHLNAHRPPPAQGFIYFDFLTNLLPVIFAIAIKYAQQILRLELNQQEAQNIKLQAELQHLKYQLQPHFFFNALNNIYSMIEFNPQKAQQSVHSLSKLMRHFMQQSEEKNILLKQEVDFLTQYIHLMTLRLTDKTSVKIDFPKQIPDLKIAPLLFISLLENAFKYGVSATQHAEIKFTLKVEGNQVIFISENVLFPKANNDLYSSGIGIENLQKRLNLLYPQKNKYFISTENQIYQARVEITL